jgi:hypothetical protein
MLVQIDRSEPQEQKEESPVARNLVSKLKLRFDEWSQARTDIEKDWIEDLRAFSALYDSTTQAALDSDPNRSQIYVTILGALALHQSLIYSMGLLNLR